jgi:hypothetical protein
VPADNSQALRKAIGGAAQQIANGQFKQWPRGASRIAQGSKGFFDWHFLLDVTNGSLRREGYGVL